VIVRPVIVAAVWIVGVFTLAAALAVSAGWTLPAVVVLALAALGTWDLVQTKQPPASYALANVDARLLAGPIFVL
jgi:hypothetical protein